MREQRREVDQRFVEPGVVDSRKKEYKSGNEIIKKVKPVVKKKSRGRIVQMAGCRVYI